VGHARQSGLSAVAAERFRRDHEENSMAATRQTRKTPRKSHNTRGAAAEQPATVIKTSKLDLIVAHLTRPDGASLADLVAATGWQAHSVRGALAGSLKKKGHAIVSKKVDGERRYRIGETR
jgi:hypothetical protein